METCKCIDCRPAYPTYLVAELFANTHKYEHPPNILNSEKWREGFQVEVQASVHVHWIEKQGS